MVPVRVPVPVPGHLLRSFLRAFHMREEETSGPDVWNAFANPILNSLAAIISVIGEQLSVSFDARASESRLATSQGQFGTRHGQLRCGWDFGPGLLSMIASRARAILGWPLFALAG
jgi:hypothetical protein